jgi:hypothetical protein
MSRVTQKIDRTGEKLVRIGWEIRDMAADGVIDAEELKRLIQRAEDVVDLAADVEDITLDIKLACQTLTLGRERVPDRHLRERIVDLARVRPTIHKRRASRLLSSRRPSENQAA